MDDYRQLQQIVGNILDAPGMGGNISVKSGEVMLVKSSGQNMKDPDHYFSWVYGVDNYSGKKPSMEYKFHLNLDSKYVVHYHPIYVMPYLCSDYEFNFDESVTLPYVAPGNELAKLVNQNKDSSIMFLKNHGVIIHADSIDEIKSMHKKIKDEFFETNKVNYTPDDAIDVSSDELWLFRNYIEFIAEGNDLMLNSLTKEQVEVLKQDPNEKYRAGEIK